MSYWKVLTRRKPLGLTLATVNGTAGAEGGRPAVGLGRVLSTFDLTALGVGATLGVGVYVLAGHVSRDLAGPSVVLSFLIAAVASFMAGLCYAEFGARVPKAGSAYIYSYVCIGELVAFVTGWNMILQYVIGSASISRGLSLYLDTILNDTLKNTFRDIAPIDSNAFADYFDFLALGLPLLLAAALAFGLKKSAIMNNVFTAVNIAIVLFVIVCGSLNADIGNWNIVPSNATEEFNVGSGGFFPFGIEGMIKGAATCFFGFVGFDCIATTGEEVKNPHRAIPKAILFSLIIIFLSYFGVSTVLTLMWPYFLQDINAPLPYAFQQIGWTTAKWIVAIGGVIGLITSLFGAMFPLPRIIYAMSADRLIFRFLGRVNETFKTPVVGTLVAGLVTGLVGAIFDLKQLVNMLSIGTLVAYTVVAISVVILRYSDNGEPNPYQEALPNSEHVKAKERGSVINQLFSCSRKPSRPNRASKKIVGFAIFTYALVSLALGLMIVHTRDPLVAGDLWAIIIWSVLVALLILMLLLIAMQPSEANDTTGFRVPWVPLIPAISVFVNIYLMLMLDMYTWIFFAVWLVLGLTIYIISAFILTPPPLPALSTDTSSVDDASNGPVVVKRNGATVMREERLEAAQSSSRSTSADHEDVDRIVAESELDDTQRGEWDMTGPLQFVEKRTPEDVALQLLDKAIEPGESTINTVSGPENIETPLDAMSVNEVPLVETIVLVHRENGSTVESTVVPEGAMEDNDSGILVVSQFSLNEQKSSVIGSTADVASDSRHHPTITHLEGTKTLPLNRGHQYQPLTSFGGVKPSKSDTDLRMMLFEEIKQLRKAESVDDEEDREEEEEEQQFSDPSPEDDIPGAPIVPIETKSPIIPEAPTFDQEKFDQMGTLSGSPLKLNTLKRKAPSPPVLAKQLSTSTIVTSPEVESPEATLTRNNPNFANFKSKLEALYSRGPPATFVKTKAPTVNRSQSMEPLGAVTSLDEELKAAKVNLRPTDTVHRQKMIFNDVLKSIHADTRPGDHKKPEAH